MSGPGLRASPASRDPDEPVAPIGGLRLTLRPLDHADLAELRRWRSDPEVQRFWGSAPSSDDGLWEEATSPGSGELVPYVIEERGRGLGYICYRHDGNTAEDRLRAGIDLYLGAAGSRDRGVGTEAVRMLLGHLFEVQGVHIVTIDPEPANKRAIRAYEKAGFRLDGVLRHTDRIDGRWVDAHYMSILEGEWPEAKARWLEEQAGSG